MSVLVSFVSFWHLYLQFMCLLWSPRGDVFMQMSDLNQWRVLILSAKRRYMCSERQRAAPWRKTPDWASQMLHSKVPVTSEATLLPKVQYLKNSVIQWEVSQVWRQRSTSASQTAPQAEKVAWPPTSILRKTGETQPLTTQQQPSSSQMAACQKQTQDRGNSKPVISPFSSQLSLPVLSRTSFSTTFNQSTFS